MLPVRSFLTSKTYRAGLGVSFPPTPEPPSASLACKRPNYELTEVKRVQKWRTRENHNPSRLSPKARHHLSNKQLHVRGVRELVEFNLEKVKAKLGKLLNTFRDR